MQLSDSTSRAATDFEIECLSIATTVASSAAEAVIGTGRGVRSERHRDIKIEADFAADRHIHEELARRSDVPVLSEERERPLARDVEGYRWIVDPVDGSFNFARGIPFCCVSIGLWKGREPIAGVIRDLDRGELFTGLVGRGAWLDGAPMRVSAVRERARAVLCSGLPGAGEHGAERLARLTARANAFKKIRLLGSAALMLAYVACGRADRYAEDGIAIWDVGAGLALVKAAGGSYRWRPAAGDDRFDVEADNGVLERDDTSVAGQAS